MELTFKATTKPCSISALTNKGLERMFRCVVLLMLSCVAGIAAAESALEVKNSQAEWPSLQLLTEHSPPGEYLNEQGELAGVTYELIAQIAQQLGEPVTFRLLPWARAFTMATTQSDKALFETTRTTEREALFQWVGPLKIHNVAMYARRDRFNPAIPTELWSRLYSACEYKKSAHLTTLTEWGFTEEPELFKPLHQGDCFTMLMRRRVDIILLSETALAMRLPELLANGVELVKIAGFATTTQYLAFSLDVAPERVQRWQRALMQNYADGQMRDRYQGVYPDEMITALELLGKAYLDPQASDNQAQPISK